MIRRTFLGLLSSWFSTPTQAQVTPTPFPQTLPPNSVVGRLGAGLAGPAEAIPFASIGIASRPSNNTQSTEYRLFNASGNPQWSVGSYGISDPNFPDRFYIYQYLDASGAVVNLERLGINDSGGVVIGRVLGNVTDIDATTPFTVTAQLNSNGSGLGGGDGSANQWAQRIAATAPVTNSAAGYEKLGLFVTINTADPSHYSPTIARDVGGCDIRGIIDTGNTLGRAWGGLFLAQAQTGADGILTGVEIDVENGGSDATAFVSTNTKVGLLIVPIGNPLTAGIYLTAGDAGTVHNGVFATADVLTSTGKFLVMQDPTFTTDLFSVLKNGAVTSKNYFYSTAPGFGYVLSSSGNDYGLVQNWSSLNVGTDVWSLGSSPDLSTFTDALRWTGTSASNPYQVTIPTGFALSPPNTQSGTGAAGYAVVATDYTIINDRTGTLTLTLPAAAAYPGRIFICKSGANAQAVISNASNVVPLVGGSASTPILAATAGKWAMLQSNGTSWVIMAGN